MVDRSILYNLYKFDLFKALNKVNTQPAYTKIDFSCVMTTNISKSATDLFIWYCWLVYLNKISVKQLSIIGIGIEIVQLSDKILPLCKVCIKAKIICQPH